MGEANILEVREETPPPHGTAPFAAALIASAALAACGGGGGDDGGGTGGLPGFGDAPLPPEEPMGTNDAARLLAQGTLGASRADITQAAGGGARRWIEEQFQIEPTQGHFDWMMANGFGVEANRNNTAGLDNSIWRKFIASPDALRQRMVFALSQILTVSVSGIDTDWRQFCVGHYLDILERNAFGNYRQLLEDVSLSTAMGYYLTYRGNAKANGRGSQPDENYARELMQLFTIGLLHLRPDGTVDGARGETYEPEDVSGLARVFTGWDRDTAGLTSPYPPGIHQRPLAQVANRYETGAKSFLGTTIPSGTSAIAALRTALDVLFRHPNVPPFVCRQLIQRLVSSNPSAAYVGRVAAAFVDNGQGVRGDLKAVLRAILLDPEARDTAAAARNPAFGKVREPVVRFLNWARGFRASSPSGLWAIGDLSDAGSRLGQSPMRAPSVFNFYRPGYVPPGGALAAAGLTAPELQIANETSVAGYLNYMQRAVAGSGIGDVRGDHAPLMALATNSRALLDEINLVLAAGQLAPATIATLQAALDTINAGTETGRRNRVQAALVLVLAAPEFIAQK
ncbi:DUF1800 domain-containing protein [Ramlibacter pallidus]